MTYFRIILILSMICSVAYGQTNTPTPTFTETFTPTPTPIYGGMAGKVRDGERKFAMDRAPHIFNQGWAVAEPLETRAYVARPAYDTYGNSEMDLANLLPNTMFTNDIGSWTDSGATTASYDGTETDLDAGGGTGSMQLVSTGAGTVFLSVSHIAPRDDYYTFGCAVKAAASVTFNLTMPMTSPSDSGTQSRTVLDDQGDWQIVTITKFVVKDQNIGSVGLSFTTSQTVHVDNVGLYRSPNWPGFIPEGQVSGTSGSYTDINLSGSLILDSDTRFTNVTGNGMLQIEGGADSTFYGNIAEANAVPTPFAIPTIDADDNWIFTLGPRVRIRDRLIVLYGDDVANENFAVWRVERTGTPTPLPTLLPDNGIWLDNDTYLGDSDGIQIGVNNIWDISSTAGILQVESPDAGWLTTTYTPLIFGGAGGVWSNKAETSGGITVVGYNVYYDGAEKNVFNDESSRYVQTDGTHTFQAEGAAAADTAISWDTQLLIEADKDIVAYGDLTTTLDTIGQAANVRDVYDNPDMTADNETVLVDGRSVIVLTDDGTVLTVVLSETGALDGQVVVLYYDDNNTQPWSMADSSPMTLSAAWSPARDDTLSLIYITGQGWVETSRSAN